MKYSKRLRSSSEFDEQQSKIANSVQSIDRINKYIVSSIPELGIETPAEFVFEKIVDLNIFVWNDLLNCILFIFRLWFQDTLSNW